MWRCARTSAGVRHAGAPRFLLGRGLRHASAAPPAVRCGQRLLRAAPGGVRLLASRGAGAEGGGVQSHGGAASRQSRGDSEAGARQQVAGRRRAARHLRVLRRQQPAAAQRDLLARAGAERSAVRRAGRPAAGAVRRPDPVGGCARVGVRPRHVRGAARSRRHGVQGGASQAADGRLPRIPGGRAVLAGAGAREHAGRAAGPRDGLLHGRRVEGGARLCRGAPAVGRRERLRAGDGLHQRLLPTVPLPGAVAAALLLLVPRADLRQVEGVGRDDRRAANERGGLSVGGEAADCLLPRIAQ